MESQNTGLMVSVVDLHTQKQPYQSHVSRLHHFSLNVHAAFLDGIVRSGDPILSRYCDGCGVCGENTGSWRFSLAAQQIDMSASASALFAV